jgi:hypothetical protein
MKAGFIVDVTHPCPNDIPRLKSSGMFQGMDIGRLTHSGPAQFSGDTTHYRVNP